MRASSYTTFEVRRRRTFRILVAVGVVVIAGLSVYSVLDNVFWPTTWVGRYVAITSEYRRITADRPVGTDLLAVFPVEVPPAAQDVRFYYWTPPGDVVLQLHCTLPPADVAAIVRRWSATALSTARGGEQMSGYYRGPVNYDPFYVCDQPGGQHLSEAYVVYTTAVGHTAIDRNARYSYEVGVAVNDKRNDVIYWLLGHAEEAPSGVQPAGVARP